MKYNIDTTNQESLLINNSTTYTRNNGVVVNENDVYMYNQYYATSLSFVSKITDFLLINLNLNWYVLDSSLNLPTFNIEYNNNHIYVSNSVYADPPPPYLPSNYGKVIEIDLSGNLTNSNFIPNITAGNTYINIAYLTIQNGQFYIIELDNNLTNYGQQIYGLLSPTPCFKEDTKILSLRDDKETYVLIQDIRKGDLIKTSRDGYVPVNMIGHSVIFNPGNDSRIKDRLYICTNDKYPELTEDLYITGCHSILVDNISDVERELIIEHFEKVYVTDGKYRLMAMVDEKAIPYENEGRYNIWHLALEHDDIYMNYGIYANGLLVETCSKRYMKKLSNMTLVE